MWENKSPFRLSEFFGQTRKQVSPSERVWKAAGLASASAPTRTCLVNSQNWFLDFLSGFRKSSFPARPTWWCRRESSFETRPLRDWIETESTRLFEERSWWKWGLGSFAEWWNIWTRFWSKSKWSRDFCCSPRTGSKAVCCCTDLEKAKFNWN